ncbi:PIN domain-containing protein [Methylobacterium sp. JK268]
MDVLDTTILSEAAPTKDRAHTFAELRDGLEAATDHLWLSVVSVAEIAAGAEEADLRGHRQKAIRLRAWLETAEHLYGNRVLPLDRETARLAGKLSAHAKMSGASPGFADAAIAATAEVHGLRLMTRNTKDFIPLGVACIDPDRDGLPPIPGTLGSGGAPSGR